MAELREINLPEHFFQYPEMAEIDRVSDEFISKFYDDLEGIHDDIMIMTATERGIARREAILGITPADTDSLEARRARVLMKWYEKNPYTRKVIERKIAVLCGDGAYTFEYHPDTMVLTVEMEGVAWDVINTVREVLEQMVRLMIILDVKQIFVSSADAYTYKALANLGTIEYAKTIELGG